MYFKKLEIFGFKSFAEKTALTFEPGITAIVGPNGCGKSNVFDSIRWVLGEQSVKELRGRSMEDVIFNGTDKKPSLGFAEVSLTFDNQSRSLPIEYDEVTITRRLFRSGESEYLLNKTAVRLKDVQELLMGTGIGAEAYSMIQQGKVDRVVSAKPEDRRELLDEAAGITKYKAKKKEALSKLKATEENLLRVNDITQEVKRQIGSIERQANKARKYKENFERLAVMEVVMARRQMDALTAQRQQLSAQLQALSGKERSMRAEIEEIAERLTIEINYLDEIEQKMNEVHADEIKIDGAIDLTQRQISFNQERIDGIHASNEKLQQQKGQLIERCHAQQEKIEALKREHSLLEQAIVEGQETLTRKKGDLDACERAIRDAKYAIKNGEEQVLVFSSQQVAMRNELTDVIKEMQGHLARKRRLDVEDEKVSGEKMVVEHKLQSADSQIQALEREMGHLRETFGQREQTLVSLRSSLSDIEGTIDDLEKKRLFFRSQKEFIEKLNTQYNDIPDPIITGHLITQTPPLAHHTGIIGKVRESRLLSGDERGITLARCFSSPDAGALYEITCETKFIELDPQQISQKIEEIGVEIVGLTARREELERTIAVEASGLHELTEVLQEKDKVFSVLDAQRRSICEEIQKLMSELELVDVERVEVQESLVSIKKKEEELNFRLDTVTQDIASYQNIMREKQQWISDKAQEKEHVMVAVAQLETELQSHADKLAGQADNENMFTEALDGWLMEIKNIDDELVGNRQKEDRYQQEVGQLQVEVTRLTTEKESFRGVLSEYTAQKEDLGQRINSMRAHMVSSEQELDAMKQRAHDQQMTEQEISFNEQRLRERLSQAYKIDLDAPTPEGFVVPDDVVAMNEEALVVEVDVLRKRCESFGAVNLVAIDEYEELKQRFEFLTKQQSDLFEARSQLMETIKKINRSTRQMFMNTFTRVSEEFRIYFRMLFGGGEAQLILLDPENVLESGIDIIARPPGKKLQNISLLSGGEKTLTAIALIFGIFKVNPSPFCVLDEIDAALDESNVGRFSYLLEDFAKIAQFIVITHNKKTMAHADIMYGITMPETGISRLVSVKFSDEKDKKKEVAEEVPVAV